jgi:opacity protein-like surface antigen
MNWSFVSLILAVVLAAALTAPACAFEPDLIFQRGTLIGSIDGGGGEQSNLSGSSNQTGLSLWYVTARVGLLPFGTTFERPFRGAFEVAIGPVYQRYTEPVTAFYAGLAAFLRYHFTALGRFVPYIEVAGAMGGTDLRIREIDSDFAFWLAAGAGAEFFVTDRVAIYAGYRLVHISNGNTDTPNTGFEAHTAVGGVSIFYQK